VRGARKDAERELTRLLHELDEGSWTDPGRLTLGRYLEERWLPHSATRVRPSTHRRYLGLVRRHIVPRIGRVKLAKLRPSHAQAVLDAMIAGGASSASVVQCHRVLSSALRTAVKWHILATNPAAGVSPPRVERREIHVPDALAIRRLLEESRSTEAYVPVVIAAATGMRRGEVLGLRWRDVDLDVGKARVVATLQRVRGDLVFVSPKTDQARRTITLPPFAIEALRRHRREQAERRLLVGPAWVDVDVVVDRGDGTPLDPDTFTHRFERAAERAGLRTNGRRVSLHGLRHAYATTMLVSGVHPKVVSEALGHANIAFTMRVYQHVLPTMGEQAAAAIEAALGSTS
jgi:integrase